MLNVAVVSSNVSGQEEQNILDTQELGEFVGSAIIYALDVMAKNEKTREFIAFISKKYKLEELFAPCFDEKNPQMVQVHSKYQEMLDAFVESYRENYASKPYNMRQNYRETTYFVMYIYYLPLERYFNNNYVPKAKQLDSSMYRKCHNFINDIQKNFPEVKRLIGEAQKIKKETKQSKENMLMREDYEIEALHTMAILYLEILYDVPYKKIVQKSSKDKEFQYECILTLNFNTLPALSLAVFFLKTILERVNTENDVYLYLPYKGLILGIKNETEEKLKTNSVILRYKEEFEKKQKTEVPIENITLESIYERTKHYLTSFPTEEIYNTVRNFSNEVSIYDNSIKLPENVRNARFLVQLYSRHFGTVLRSEEDYKAIPIESRYLSALVERLNVLPTVYEFAETNLDTETITEVEKKIASKVIADSFSDIAITIAKIGNKELRQKCKEEHEQFRTFFTDKERIGPIYSLLIQYLKALRSAQTLQRMLFNMEKVMKTFQDEHKESEHYREQLEMREKQHQEEMAAMKSNYQAEKEKNKRLDKTLAQFESIKAQLEEKNEQVKMLEARQEEIQYLNEQLQMLSENDELEEQLNEGKSVLDKTLSGHPFTDEIYHKFIEQLNTDKTLILGGHEKIQQRMQKLLPNALIRDASALGHDIDSWVKRMDYIVLNTHVMNHSMSKSLKSALKRSGTDTPILYVNSRATNSKVTFALIYDEYKRYEKEQTTID